MSVIKRIGYKNPSNTADIDIVRLEDFFKTRPKKILEQDRRLEFWAIIYITRGRGAHYVDFEKYTYGPGSVFLVQRHQVQCFEVNENSDESPSGYIIHLNEPFINKADSHMTQMFFDLFDRSFQGPHITVDTSEHTTNRAIIDLLHKESADLGDVPSFNLVHSLFYSFVAALLKVVEGEVAINSKPQFETYETYRKLIEDRFKDIKIVETYANMMGVSKKTLNNATRRIVGLSAKQLISDRLILEIKRYLSQGDLLIYEISDLMGFDEPANMTRFFKRYTGLSPKAFQSSRMGGGKGIE